MDDKETVHQQLLFTRDVLDMFWQLDIHEDLFWRVDNGMPTFYVKCSDVFAWGTADLEKIVPGNLSELLMAYRDIFALAGDAEAMTYCTDLFVARVRRMRPQGAAYPKDKRLWPLFDAAGPKRVVGISNPHKHPGDSS